MLNGITNVADAQSLLQNSASKEIYGTSYEDAINTTVVGGGLAILAGAGVYAGTAVARNVGGFSVASVIPEITAKVGAVGTWLAKPKAVLVKAGSALSTGTVGVLAKGAIWAVGVAVASALGLTIGSNLYNWIDENKPEAWVWLDNKLTEIGWRDFDFALAENGLSYLPTAVVELYRDWFEYLGLFNAGGVDRTMTNETLIVTEFSTVSYLDAFSEYNGEYAYDTILQKMEEENIVVGERDYLVCRFLSGNNMDVHYFKNVEQFEYDTIGDYSRNAQGHLDPMNVWITCDESWLFSESSWGTLASKRTDTKRAVEFTITSLSVENNTYQDNLGVLVSAIPDVEKQTGATLPNSGVPLSTTYPDWYAKKMSITTPNTSVDFLPVAIPQVDPLVDDTILSQTDAQTGVVDETKPWVGTQLEIGSNSAVQDLVDAGVNVPANPPMTPIGSTPIEPFTPFDPVGMFAVWNPTVTEVMDFSKFLWTTNFVDNVKKLFLDPMEGIIGFFQIYATPTVSEQKSEISIGWLGTNVNASRVIDKFISIDCGTITPWQYFGNVLDFNPYTSVQMYLPFIGIVPLDANLVIGKSINVKYEIDVVTATCDANIYCDGQLLYTFAGNCGVQMPVTASNYSAVISGLVSVAGGVLATVATGGTVGAIATIGSASQALVNKTHIQQSGSLGGNAGVLAPRKPYMIIERPISHEALEYQTFYGIPSNKRVVLSSLNGYTKVKSLHLENINATETELDMIEELLLEGVIV